MGAVALAISVAVVFQLRNHQPDSVEPDTASNAVRELQPEGMATGAPVIGNDTDTNTSNGNRSAVTNRLPSTSSHTSSHRQEPLRHIRVAVRTRPVEAARTAHLYLHLGFGFPLQLMPRDDSGTGPRFTAIPQATYLDSNGKQTVEGDPVWFEFRTNANDRGPDEFDSTPELLADLTVGDISGIGFASRGDTNWELGSYRLEVNGKPFAERDDIHASAGVGRQSARDQLTRLSPQIATLKESVDDLTRLSRSGTVSPEELSILKEKNDGLTTLRLTSERLQGVLDGSHPWFVEAEQHLPEHIASKRPTLIRAVNVTLFTNGDPFSGSLNPIYLWASGHKHLLSGATDRLRPAGSPQTFVIPAAELALNPLSHAELKEIGIGMIGDDQPPAAVADRAHIDRLIIKADGRTVYDTEAKVADRNSLARTALVPRRYRDLSGNVVDYPQSVVDVALWRPAATSIDDSTLTNTDRSQTESVARRNASDPSATRPGDLTTDDVRGPEPGRDRLPQVEITESTQAVNRRPEESPAKARAAGKAPATEAASGPKLTSAGKSDLFVARMSPDGTVKQAVRLGGAGQDNARQLVVDNQKNIYVAGTAGGVDDLSAPTESAFGVQDILLTKIAADGEVKWKTVLGGSAWDEATGIAIDPDGNTYATGFFNGRAHFGDDRILTTEGATDAFALRLNPVGKVDWAIALGGSGADTGTHAAIGSSGDLLIAGDFGSPWLTEGSHKLINAGELDGFLVCINTETGALNWAKQLGGPGNETVSALSLDSTGHIYVTGALEDTAEFDSHAVESAGETDGYVAKLTPDGRVLWSTGLGGTEWDTVSSVVVNDSGNRIHVTGTFEGTIRLGASTLSSNGDSDTFVAELDGFGNIVSAVGLGGSGDDHGRSITVDEDGTIYVAGAYADSIQPSRGSRHSRRRGNSEGAPASESAVPKPARRTAPIVDIQPAPVATTLSKVRITNDQIVEDGQPVVVTWKTANDATVTGYQIRLMPVIPHLPDWIGPPVATQRSPAIQSAILTPDLSGLTDPAHVDKLSIWIRPVVTALDSTGAPVTTAYGPLRPVLPGNASSNVVRLTRGPLPLETQSDRSFELLSSFGGTQHDDAHGVAVGPGGDIFVTGSFQDTAQFAKHRSATESQDSFVLKLSPESGQKRVSAGFQIDGNGITGDWHPLLSRDPRNGQPTAFVLSGQAVIPHSVSLPKTLEECFIRH